MKAAVIIVVAVVAIVPIVTLALRGPSTRAAYPVAPPSSASAAPRIDRGLYSSAITDMAGRLDVTRTVAQAAAAHADTYYYLIWDRNPRTTAAPAVSTVGVSQDRWDKLPAFSDQAAKYGIKVVVYLVPPSESVQSAYQPFGWDYEQWFRQIGLVAARHRAVVGVAMDDISSNFIATGLASNKFDIGLLMRMRSALHGRAPWMRFYGLVYGHDVIGISRVLPAYRQALDGIIYAFAGPDQIRDVRQNTTDPVGLYSTTLRIRAVTDCSGHSTCWQADFQPAAQTTAAKSLYTSRTIEPSRESRSLKVIMADDRSGADGTTFAMNVTVDGMSIPISRRTISDGRSVLAGTIPGAQGSKPRTLGVRVTKSLVGRTLGVFIDSIDLSSGNRVTHLLDPSAAWSFVSMPGAEWSVVRPLQLIVMFYCARFSIEATTPGAADVGYVTRLVPQLRQVLDDHIADGIVAYRLNLTGSRRSLYEGDVRNLSMVRSLYTELGARSSSR